MKKLFSYFEMKNQRTLQIVNITTIHVNDDHLKKLLKKKTVIDGLKLLNRLSKWI